MINRMSVNTWMLGMGLLLGLSACDDALDHAADSQSALSRQQHQLAENIERIDEIQPYQFKSPIEVEVTFKSYMPAEVLSYLSNVERLDAHTVGFVLSDMLEVATFLQFISHYNISLTP